MPAAASSRSRYAAGTGCPRSLAVTPEHRQSVFPGPPQIPLAHGHPRAIEKLEDLDRELASGADVIAKSRHRDLAVLAVLGEKMCGRGQFGHGRPLIEIDRKSTRLNSSHT